MALTCNERKSLFESSVSLPTKKKFSLFSNTDRRLKKKSQALRKLFGVEDELVIDVSASRTFNTRITIPGRLFIMQRHFLFYSDVFDVEQKLTIPVCDIVTINKQDENIVVETRENKTWTFTPYGRNKDFILKHMVNIYKTASCPVEKGSESGRESSGEDDVKTDDEEEDDDDAFEWISRAAKEEGFLNTDSEGERVEIGSFELPISVKSFYRVFLQDDAFFKLYHEQRTDTNIEITPWGSHDELGNVRQLKFTVKVKGTPFGPPTSLVDETQRYYNQASDPNHLVVETMTSIRDVQYGDSFRVEGRMDITPPPDSPNKVKIVITLGVSFLKKIRIPGISATIRSRAIEDNKQSCQVFIALAKEYLAKHPPLERKLTTTGLSSSVVSPMNPTVPPTSTVPLSISAPPAISAGKSTASFLPTPSPAPVESSSFFSSVLSLHSLLIFFAVLLLFAIFWQLTSLRLDLSRLEVALRDSHHKQGSGLCEPIRDL